MGADHSLAPDEPNFATRVTALTGGCNVAYDSLGGVYFLEAVKCLRTRGDLVSYGLAAGPVPAFDVARLAGYYDADINGSLRITRTSLGDFVPTPADLRSRAAAVFSDAASGILSCDAALCLPLTEAHSAHTTFAAGKDRKMVLIPHQEAIIG